MNKPLESKMPRIIPELHALFAESAKLEEAINAKLRGLGYESQQHKQQP